jgi:hypothetical protein
MQLSSLNNSRDVELSDMFRPKVGHLQAHNTFKSPIKQDNVQLYHEVLRRKEYNNIE